jgi:hypothetical protein
VNRRRRRRRQRLRNLETGSSFLVHGDDNRLRALGNKLEQDGMKVEIPREGAVMELR